MEQRNEHETTHGHCYSQPEVEVNRVLVLGHDADRRDQSPDRTEHTDLVHREATGQKSAYHRTESYRREDSEHRRHGANHTNRYRTSGTPDKRHNLSPTISTLPRQPRTIQPVLERALPPRRSRSPYLQQVPRCYISD